MSKILIELCAATKLEVPAGAPTAAFLEGMIEKAQKLNDAAWNALSEPAADYFNDAVDAINASKAIPALPDFVSAAPAPAPAARRRTAAAPAAPAAPAYVVGDEVSVKMKDGSTVDGKVMILDDNGELVIDDGEGEVGVELALIEAVELKTPPAAAPAPAARRRTAAAPAKVAEPEVLEPEVSDTVEVVNNRDKVYLGNVVEIDEAQVVIVTTTGDELPFAREKVKSITVKVKNAGRAAAPAPAPAAPAGRARTRAAGAAPATAAGDATPQRAVNKGVSVGTRIRELILDNKGITQEQVGAKLTAEGLAFAPASLAMGFKEATQFLALLAERKMLK